MNGKLSDYLSKFPTLENLLGDWVRKELSRGKQDHCLLYCLNKGEPNWNRIRSLMTGKMDVATCVIVNELQLHHSHLQNLESHLTILVNEPHLDRFLEHLEQPDNFWQGYSEIETAALFKRRFSSIQLEPSLPNCSRVDFAFPFGKKSIYTEVNTPKMGQEFLDALVKHSVPIGGKPKAYNIPDSSDRVKDIILREFEHFDGANVPSLTIYNLNKSEFDGEDVADRLRGTAYAQTLTKKSTGKSSLHWKRKADSVFINDPDLKDLGGIICYKREFNVKGQVSYAPLHLIGIAFPVRDMERLGKAFG